MVGTRILIVEDGRETASVVMRILQYEGCTVERVTTGGAAMQALVDRTFHMILLDVGLPDVNGVDVLRSLRTRDVTVPVIMMSGQQDVTKEALQLGAQGYLVKPFTVEALREHLTRWIK